MSRLDPYDQAILMALRTINIPLSVRKIAEKTRMHPNTVAAHLEKLENIDMIQTVDFGKMKKFKI